jgi:integrase
MKKNFSNPPKYRHFKPKNLAVVRIAGHDHYLGKYDSQESRERYDQLIGEWLINHRQPVASANSLAPASGNSEITVNELILAFWEHAKQRYIKHGKSTSEIQSYRMALRPVRRLYGSGSVAKFGPLALVACRQKLIEAGYCRKRINQHIGRIRHVFKWGVARELVSESVWRALCAVEGLRFGEAPETQPVKPVAEDHITAIEPFLTPHVWAMINLQLWTGCRPGEVCLMRTADINTQTWEYRPYSHKTEHHAKERVICLGPQAKAIITPWLKTDLQAYIFSPCESRQWYLAQQTKKQKRSKSNRRQTKKNPKRIPGNRYTPLSYGQAIRRACELAFKMPKELRRISKNLFAEERKQQAELAATWRKQHCWHPNQLRHNAATRIRSAHGIEAARIILGHSSAVTSEIYADIDLNKAKSIMAELG